jgi:hypothetical protein
MGPASRALRILLAALLFSMAGAPGVLSRDKEQWAERLTFATGRSVAYLSSAALREPQPQVEIAIVVVDGLDRDDERNFVRIIAAARAAYYLIGTADRKRDRFLSTSPASMLQGDNRYDRWEKVRRYVGLFPEWRVRVVFAEVLGAGHSSAQMFDSRTARKAIFE